MAQTQISQVWINKQNLAQTKINQLSVDHDLMGDNQVLLAVERFGFSANNITYGALGEGMGYWGFFPADGQHGILPVWGFAKVIASNAQGIEVGERVFGYLPMATHLLITAGKVSEHGFYDVNEARKSISPVYDNYLRCSADPGYDPSREPWQLNYRPLFMTSFVLDDFVGEQLEDGIDTIVLTSASSKTAYGCAHLLSQHKQTRQRDYKVVGLTSASNQDFVESLGVYDQVLSYPNSTELNAAGKVWILDFAANGALLAQLQSQFTDKIAQTTLIGATDWQAEQKPNKRAMDAEIFFAPAQVKKRTQEWGQVGFLQKYAQAWTSFAHNLASKVEVAEFNGADAVVELYQRTLAGEVNVKAMNVVSF